VFSNHTENAPSSPSRNYTDKQHTESIYSHLNRRRKQVDPLQPTTKINQYTCSEAHKHSSHTYNLVHQEANEI